MNLDLILRGADIITLEDDRPRAHAIGILHGRIAGFDEELAGCTATCEIDLDGATVVPGFIDAHCHTTWWGLGLDSADLQHARGLDELYALLEAEATRLDELERTGDDDGATEDADRAWLHGTGFNHEHHGGAFPDIARLDAITGDRPLYLRHVSGHQAITNTATLALAGAIDPGFEDPVGGAVVRDASGKPTGVVEESAQALVQDLLLPYSRAAIVDALAAATSRYAAEGITSFTEAGIAAGWIGHSPLEVDAYQHARRTGRLHARAQLMPTLDALHEVTGHAEDLHGGTGRGLDLGLGAGFGDDWLSLGPVKVFMDGSLLGATAAVTEDFCGHPHHRGYLLDDEATYRDKVAAAYRAGWPIALHAIGDAAIGLALDIVIGCQDAHGPNPLPNRIEHFGIARPEQVHRAAAHGIAVTPQAAFIGPLGDQMAELVGPDREGWLYRGRSIVDAGGLLAGSSDLPVADNNVRRGMQAWVDRRTDTGHILGGVHDGGAPVEGLSPEEALRAYTSWAAAATGMAEDKGTLRTGKLADLVVLSGSPLDAPDISALDVLATLVGGRFTHTAFVPDTTNGSPA